MHAQRPSVDSSPDARATTGARITLLTDFGTADGYPAAMRGVIATIAPDVVVDDASHEIPPGDVHAAAFVLPRYARLYPPQTIHVAVIDPGVGSARRALAAAIDDHVYVVPDNGLLTRVLEGAASARIVALETAAYRRPDVSATFHGRDLFAPAAAWLARGIPLAELGPAIDDPVLLELPRPRREGERVAGTVVHVDRFGNLITNVPAAWLGEDAHVSVEGRAIGPLRRTYADVVSRSLLALTGSDGLLEIAVRDGSAADVLGVRRTAAVLVERR